MNLVMTFSPATLLLKILNRWRFGLYALYARLFASKTVKLASQGRSVTILTGTPHEAFRALTLLTKEPETVGWIDQFAADGQSAPVLFDIGANIGIYSLYAAAANPAATIFAFEPESQSFAALCKNIAANRFDNITPYQFAVSDQAGIGSLHVAMLAAGAGAAALGEDYRFMKAEKREHVLQGVFVSSLDHLVFDLGLPCPNYIKIDVDGIEERILRGGKRVLSDERLRGLLVEIQYAVETDLVEAITFLNGCGLNMISKSTWEGTYIDGSHSRNVIFARRQPSGSK